MVLLSEGTPLSWEETKKYADHVRKHGIIQFINQWRKHKDRSNDCLKWGDEVEYMMVQLDHKTKKARLILRAGPVLKTLQEKKHSCPDGPPAIYTPEYAAYHIESTPGRPYGHRMAHLNLVEANMKLRREELLEVLNGPGETALTLTAFPRAGCPDFTMPHSEPSVTSGASHSLFLPDDAINGCHPRFKTLTRNIRHRKGRKIAVNLPVFKDVKTKSPFTEDLAALGDDGESQRVAKPDHIYMDAMGFGMGSACLQMTFQACDIQEARMLYDQLTPLCPILLALTAAAPAYRGHLVDSETRFDVIGGGVDDRTDEELGLKPLRENNFVIAKSRYGSVDSYLSEGGMKYNDIDLVMDKDIYKDLRAGGIDHLLAQHMAHLFIRDPVSLFSEKIDQNDECETDHFENIQSTNWQTMRFKPPPANSTIGWRIEFRPLEIQLTDFENAAFVIFMALITRVILSFKLDFLIPMSKVDENMERAKKRDAVMDQKFYFRRDPMTCISSMGGEADCCTKPVDETKEVDRNEYTLMTVNEIVNGKPGHFPGLIPLVKQFLESTDDIDVDTSCTIEQCLKLISMRASGELMTTARWIRQFVTNHPDYKQDSLVSDQINYDLMCLCDKIMRGEVHPPELLLPVDSKTQDDIQKAEDYLATRRAAH